MIRKAMLDFARAVRADYGSLQHYRQKYRAEVVPLARLPADAVKKIGFQMMVATRAMRLLRDLPLPLGGQVGSRLIRHLYGAEIHWNTEVHGGVCIVHGTGLVLSHRAVIGEGCILFHNVTLGEALDPVTKESGAPTLGKNVHVGPGSTLLGPIHVGDGTKIMAGTVLTQSVPPNSLVKPAEATVSARVRGSAAPDESPLEDATA